MTEWIVKKWMKSLKRLKEGEKGPCTVCGAWMDQPSGIFFKKIVYVSFLCESCTEKAYQYIYNDIIRDEIRTKAK